METKRRQQAHDSVRNGCGDHRNRFEFRGFDLGKPIETMPEALDQTLGNHSLKILIGYLKRRKVSRSEESPDARRLQLRYVQCAYHADNILNVGTYIQVYTFFI